MPKGNFSFAVFVALGLIGCAAAKAQEIGVVKTALGDARVARAGAETSLAAGDSLFVADRVITGPASAMGAVLADGTAVSMGADSQIVIQSYRFEPGEARYEMWIRAVEGRVVIRTGLIGEAAPDRIRIETPQMMIGVRGTRFAIVAPPQS